MLGEESPMLSPELVNEGNERTRKRTDGGGRWTRMLHVTPVNLDANVVVAAGISGMRQGVVPMLTSPGIFIPSSGTRLVKDIAEVRHQELLRGFSEGKATNIFDSHHLLIEFVILVTAILSIKILNLRCVGRGNACATTNNEEYIEIRKRGECHL